jgi:hypothetical protein
MWRQLIIALLSLGVGACRCGQEPTPSQASASASSAATSTEVSAADCTALRSMHAHINKRSGDFGRQNKEEGGDLAKLWRGFSKFAREDAAAPPRFTSPGAKRYEERLRDIRRRSVDAFSAMAAAEEQADPAVKDQAQKALESLGTEWRALGDDLANGCKAR